MSKQMNVNEDIYKEFQAALILTGEDEEIVLGRLISQYVRTTFEKVLGNKTVESKFGDKRVANITENEQKQLFVNWFRSLTRNGKTYNPVTISGYTGRIENACCDPTFASVPVNNLFTITDLIEFINIKNQIKGCAGYAEFDAKSHNGFTAALRKYEEFLRFQTSGDSVQLSSVASQSYSRQSNVHRWTIEEDTICCKRFLEYYVVKKSKIDTVQFLKMLAEEVPNVSEGSLRMKIQNIKHLAMQAGLKDTSPIKGLSQYSLQCERAFNQTLRDINIR